MGLYVQSAPIFEPAQVFELPCSGMGRIEFIGGGQGCFVFYRNGLAPGADHYERVAVGRVFAPLSSIIEAVELMLQAVIEARLVEQVQLSPRLGALPLLRLQ